MTLNFIVGTNTPPPILDSPERSSPTTRPLSRAKPRQTNSLHGMKQPSRLLSARRSRQTRFYAPTCPKSPPALAWRANLPQKYLRKFVLARTSSEADAQSNRSGHDPRAQAQAASGRRSEERNLS